MKIRMATLGLLTLAMSALCAPGMMTSDPAVERLSPVNANAFSTESFGGRKGRRYYFGEPRSCFARHGNSPHADRRGRPYNRTQEVERRLWQASQVEHRRLHRFHVDQTHALADILYTDELTAGAGLS